MLHESGRDDCTHGGTQPLQEQSSLRACVPRSAARTCHVGQLVSRAWPRARVAKSAASAASHKGKIRVPLALLVFPSSRALHGSTDDQLPFDHTLKLNYHSDTSMQETNVARAWKKKESQESTSRAMVAALRSSR